ncbi:MAG TPA: phosphatase PAP2 family protein [Acidimicrobiales bacterium]|nr:phosphatase PAP2 family protein [Acidimicrobiales bacterium]
MRSAGAFLAGPGPERFDRAVDAAFDRIRGNGVADAVMYGASAVGDHGMLWVGLAALRAARERERGELVRMVAVMAAESVFVNLGVKSLFRRRRPVVDVPRPYHLRIPLTSSFPSGHATSAFCAAAVLSEGSPAGPAYYALAAVVAASRVHVRIHHASDVVAGVALGTVVGRLARRIWPRGESRPRVAVFRRV